MIDFHMLAVQPVLGLTPYQPGKPIEELARELGLEPAEIVKLASNENPLGPSPKALDAMRRALPETARYPDGSGFALKHKLARKLGVQPQQITLGNGSNDVLDLIARVFLGPGRSAVFSEHAFAVYPIATQAVGARARIAPAHDGSRGPRYSHDLGAMLDRVSGDTTVVFIANPNNPTGTYVTRKQLEDFLAALPERVIAVVDEAYFEYVERDDYPDALAWLDRFPNLIVTRTFSKAYGLAGLRVGYAVSHPQVAELLNRVRQPFNVNHVALATAEAALDDENHLRKTRHTNREGLMQLEAAFQRLGLDYIPSIGNFITVDVGREAQPVFDALLRQGVIVRPVANYGLPNHLRVSVGTAAENAACIAALEKVL
ncbi:histidinol-phosphate aminotransferase [Methylomarinovum caldicuralii]|uniref:Histidinol-phosphate aminotransferase n=1 Tax=Methylomarinovum caldicuralii TaxID=438856 RepID=A0AAU9CPX7_9GAMM|nr:histidinol-phosphate transaminase [Methylomarinovum caldicuralii]BCX81567.1 histidinol-phosphate aminotransferase [Methylomarinovum caldicuralii]